ncbi:MAG TPA: HAMP domain-containing sensor histidine kinase [Anaerolineae bacterium]|nr:HAMP domain-containing sensor histidine kinase [Anaerolineae bacterium]
MNIPSEAQVTQDPLAEIAALRTKIESLEREIRDQQVLLESLAEHSDSLQAELLDFNLQLEQRVAERTAELQTAYQVLEKMNENKSVFIDLIAHELRTPLTVIKGHAQMLQSITGSLHNEVVDRFVDGLVKGAERLEALVNSTLDVAKIENSTLSLTKRAVYMWELFEPIEATYRKVLEARGLKLTVDIASLPPTLADAKLLYRTFDELISNAVKYTPDGGQITVTGDIYATETEDATSDSFLHISVADTGIGIAPDHHQLIFEKFYQLGKVEVHSSSRTNYRGGGPGLGLAVARGVIEAHKGRIWAESPGFNEQTFPGSTFHVLLPLLTWELDKQKKQE